MRNPEIRLARGRRWMAAATAVWMTAAATRSQDGMAVSWPGSVASRHVEGVEPEITEKAPGTAPPAMPAGRRPVKPRDVRSSTGAGSGHAVTAVRDESMEKHRLALGAAMASEEAARREALRDPDRVTDDELRSLVEAIGRYEGIIEADPESMAGRAAWHGVARCEFRIGRFWAAFRALEKSYPGEYDPLLVTALASTQWMLADRLFGRGHARVPGGWGGTGGDKNSTGYGAARDVYRAMVVNQPRHPLNGRALVRYGVCSLELGDYTSAEGAFRQAIGQYGRGETATEARIRLAETLLRQYRGTDFPPEKRIEVDGLLSEAGFENAAAAGLAGLGQKIGPSGLPSQAVAPSRPVEMTEKTARERDERAANETLAQAQRFLRMAGPRTREAAKYQLTDVVNLYPGTDSAAIARSLLAHHFP